MKIIIFFLIAFSTINVGYSQNDSLLIVKDNIGHAVIVIPDSATEQIKSAATFLQDVIQKSTHVILPVSTTVEKEKCAIHIGLTSFVKKRALNRTAIDEDGFMLQTIDSNNFVIFGGSDWGTEFGVYDFLERTLGVEALMPLNVGLDIPIFKTIAIPQIRIVSNPSFLSRQISPININVGSLLGKWGRFNRLKGSVSIQHNLANLFDPNIYWKTNPDFYANSKTISYPQVGKWQPNFSAKGITDSAVNSIIRFFKNNPFQQSYSLGINDNTIFDESPISKSRRINRKNFLGFEDVSNDYFKWANAVVEKVSKIFPNRKFGVLAYNNIAEPPSADIGIDSHIIPFLTYERMRWSDTALREQGHKLTEAWANEAKQIGFYDYTYGFNYLLPRVWFHEMQDYLIWGSQHKVKYYYAELYPNWGEGPKPWIQAKLLWNPYYNVDSLLNVWYVKTAGEKAAQKLKGFYAIWENFWTKDIFNSKWSSARLVYLPFDNLSYLDAVPKNYLDSSDLLMQQAVTLASTSEQKARVMELEKMWELYKTAVLVYQNSQGTIKEKTEQLKSSPQFLASLNSLQGDPLHKLTIQFIMQRFKIKTLQQ